LAELAIRWKNYRGIVEVLAINLDRDLLVE